MFVTKLLIQIYDNLWTLIKYFPSKSKSDFLKNCRTYNKRYIYLVQGSNNI